MKLKCFDLKTVVTLSVTAAVIFGFFNCLITNKQFIPLATMVFMYYFNKKSNDGSQ